MKNSELTSIAWFVPGDGEEWPQVFSVEWTNDGRAARMLLNAPDAKKAAGYATFGKPELVKEVRVATRDEFKQWEESTADARRGGKKSFKREMRKLRAR